MNITDVKTDIKNGAIRPYYIFTGDEFEVQRIYINKIADVLGYDVRRVNSLSEIWSELTSPVLFGSACVYVIRDDKDILQDETVQTRLAQGNLNDNIVILLITAVDKRTKFYKANADKIVLFERLSTDMLVKYCQRLITLNRANCERLIAICENDYSRILLEIDKIKQYKEWLVDEGYDKETDNSLPSCYADSIFEYLVKEGVIAVPPQDAVFDLVDAILKRQVKRAYYLFDQCKQIGEANMVILSVLYNNAKQVLQVQACESKDVCKATGLTAWQVKCVKEKADKYTDGELVNVLKSIQKIQKDIITGQLDETIAVDYLLVQIL